MSKNKISYGLDFGTTNSTIAYVNDDEKVVKLPVDSDSENQSVMRSVIYASHDGKFLFGKSAIDAYLLDIAENKTKAKKTIFTGNYIPINDDYGHKKLVPEIIDIEVHAGGRLFQSLKSALANSTISKINIFEKTIEIEELVGMFIKEIKQRADRIVGQEIKTAVIGRPVNYVNNNNDLAIKRMEKACSLAGFTKVDFEYEPVGAVYDYESQLKENQNVLIFDFGGGTLDLSIFKFPERTILVNAGLPIGGDHFNSEIFMEKLAIFFGKGATWGDKQLELPNHIFESLKSWYGISLLKTNDFENTLDNLMYRCSDREALKRLRLLVMNNLGFAMYEEIERVKKSLSENDMDFYKFHNRSLDIETKITIQEFEKILNEDLRRIRNFIDDTLDKANIKAENIGKVVTTGGSSLIPAVQLLLADIFGAQKIQGSDVFTSVASGLAKIANKRE